MRLAVQLPETNRDPKLGVVLVGDLPEVFSGSLAVSCPWTANGLQPPACVFEVPKNRRTTRRADRADMGSRRHRRPVGVSCRNEEPQRLRRAYRRRPCKTALQAQGTSDGGWPPVSVDPRRLGFANLLADRPSRRHRPPHVPRPARDDLQGLAGCRRTRQPRAEAARERGTCGDEWVQRGRL